MIQAQTQTAEYWELQFSLQDSDIEHIYNYYLDVLRPQTVQELAQVVIKNRVEEEKRTIERRLADRTIYQPRKNYEVGEELVFPVLQFAYGEVTDTRSGYNPQYGEFDVITVEINGKVREFAAGLGIDHPLNQDNGNDVSQFIQVDVDELYQQYVPTVARKLSRKLDELEDFVQLANKWFVKGLMVEVNAGHLHLTEAILELNEGGPLETEKILSELDMDPDINQEVQSFSLNYGLLNDDRFDEVAPAGGVAWFLRRLEPDEVRKVPERLVYESIPYDRALLSPQLLTLERELDDEWSELSPLGAVEPATLYLTYPHRWAGALPLSSRVQPLIPTGRSPRQIITLMDEATEEEIQAWVVQSGRYIYGLDEWYKENEIAVGAYIYLKPGPNPDTILLNYDRRRPQREWVRLASVSDNRIRFELKRRSVGCGYDDLMIVGTDVVGAVDALWRRAKKQQRSVASLLAEVFPELANLTPQNTVHAKTLYSAVNMLRRVPPGPIFAELVRHPAFQPVGDHYWRFDPDRWHGS